MNEENAKTNAPERILNRIRPTPTTQEDPAIYDIYIKQVENGYTVQAGCKTFVFPDLVEMQAAISLYFTDQQKAREKYCKKG